MSSKVIEMLRQRRIELDGLAVTYPSWQKVTEWHARTRPVLKQYFPEQVDKFDEFLQPRWSFFPRVVVSGGGPNQNADVDARERQANNNIAQAAKARLLAHLDAVIELAVLGEEEAAAPPRPERATITTNQNNNVFIVHGHDEGMQQAAARALSKLGLDPVILSEQANEGRTIIEKFESSSDQVGFAVILFSPDDKAHSTKAAPDTARLRARQNVVLELGYFASKLGRGRVFVMKFGELEMPSDISGVVYTTYDNPSGNWRFELVRELKAAGYPVDANKLI
ncbi:MAG: TIR domain-containing protein [Fimbriiglobus sp.]